jgi:hypothetical protein
MCFELFSLSVTRNDAWNAVMKAYPITIPIAEKKDFNPLRINVPLSVSGSGWLRVVIDVSLPDKVRASAEFINWLKLKQGKTIMPHTTGKRDISRPHIHEYCRRVDGCRVLKDGVAQYFFWLLTAVPKVFIKHVRAVLGLFVAFRVVNQELVHPLQRKDGRWWCTRPQTWIDESRRVSDRCGVREGQRREQGRSAHRTHVAHDIHDEIVIRRPDGALVVLWSMQDVTSTSRTHPMEGSKER